MSEIPAITPSGDSEKTTLADLLTALGDGVDVDAEEARKQGGKGAADTKEQGSRIR